MTCLAEVSEHKINEYFQDIELELLGDMTNVSTSVHVGSSIKTSTFLNASNSSMRTSKIAMLKGDPNLVKNSKKIDSNLNKEMKELQEKEEEILRKLIFG
jgi:hypothetical protein